MSWLIDLFVGTGVAHSIFIVALVIFVGLMLSRIKISSVSLGLTWILFAGILAGQLGCAIDPATASFIKEFGLILFVFSLGMELGPGFFSSFRKGGVTLNLLAFVLVLCGCLATLTVHWATGESLLTLVGVMSGAVTNTPCMGAAQQTLLDMTGTQEPTIAQGYAVAYPLGVVGVILCLALLRKMFRIDFKKEDDILLRANHDMAETLEAATLEVANEAVCGKTLNEIQRHFGRQCVITRILHRASGDVELAGAATTLQLGDKLFMVATPEELSAMELLIGHRIETMDQGAWDAMKTNHLASQKFVITNPSINGKRLGDMKLRQTFDVTITRIRRAGVELIATPGLLLQMGDTVTVVGDTQRINKLSPILGNSIKQLNEPNLIPYFLGIVLGVMLGMLPIVVPGMPVPVKLGLAGGPLIVAILISTFGPKLKIVTYMSTSANHMVRMIGLSLFLASVGITAGSGFIETVVGGGYWWVLYGFLITFLPCLVVGLLARSVFHLSYYSISGMLSGGMTDPIVMAYAQNVCDNNQVPVAYSTVYPLTMFLRVLTAEVMVLFCL
ncbi:MAG: putative transporter [Bacteroidaceae bacterium]|jgi:putative transport protein|nr:putative transporter [Bacteroidaceae bacterium]